MSDNKSVLKIKNLTIGYKDIPILEDINMTVQTGEIVGIIGGNGSGKTTFLRTISGITSELKGEIFINRQSISHRSITERVRNFRLGYLLQHNRTIPDLTVKENMHLAQWCIDSGSQRERNIKEIFTRRPFDKLQNHVDDYAGVLSGGEELLLALAMLLLQDSEVILLDEPSDGLDESNRSMIVDTIQNLKSPGRIIIIVEQLLRVVFTVSDRIYLVKLGRMTSETDGDIMPSSVKTLSELDSDNVSLIKKIYRQNPVLSLTQTDELNSLLWTESRQTKTV